jgi:hypothetical protein
MAAAGRFGPQASPGRHQQCNQADRCALAAHPAVALPGLPPPLTLALHPSPGLAWLQKESPLHYLRVDARGYKLFKNEAQYYAIENNEGLVPWNGQQDCLIDRYDVRALLDMYVEPDTR